MAYIYFLSIECGSDRGPAEAVCRHFEGLSFTLSDGFYTECKSETHLDEEGNWWAAIVPSGFSMGCPTDPTRINESKRDVLEAELNLLLYERLKTAPPFRFADVGLESLEFRTYRELCEPGELWHYLWHGLVLSEPLWDHLNRHPSFVPFSDSYVWRPFGEDSE